jgi:hypothetical protein
MPIKSKLTPLKYSRNFARFFCLFTLISREVTDCLKHFQLESSQDLKLFHGSC